MTSSPLIRQSVVYFEASSDDDGQRLDNFLMSRLNKLPRSHLYRIVRTGQVRVNGGRCKISTRICAGDRVRVPPLNLQVRESKVAGVEQLKLLESAIIYEDEHIVAINKPSLFAVHGGSGIRMGIIEVLKQVPRFSDYLELGHRLDRETSGTLIMARNRKALTGLHSMFRRDQSGMLKTYHALCLGKLPQKIQDVGASILRVNNSQGPKCVVDSDGQVAHSTFIEEESFEEACLVKIQLHTGRTHQARVHASYLGIPILGVSMYGDLPANRRFKRIGLNRLFLHASSLQIVHPVSKKKMCLLSPLPEKLQMVLQNLRLIHQ